MSEHVIGIDHATGTDRKRFTLVRGSPDGSRTIISTAETEWELRSMLPPEWSEPTPPDATRFDDMPPKLSAEPITLTALAMAGAIAPGVLGLCPRRQGHQPKRSESDIAERIAKAEAKRERIRERNRRIEAAKLETP